MSKFQIVSGRRARAGSHRLHYLAYGSNLHPLRLRERVPSAELLGIVQVPGWMVKFRKRGQDRSAKCDLVRTYAGDLAYAALYTLQAGDKPRLDAAEGAGRGYDESTLEVTLAGRVFTPFVYLAAATHVDPMLQPFHWYRQLVIAGARYHRMPAAHVAALAAVPAVRDPDAARALQHEQLLGRIEALGLARE